MVTFAGIIWSNSLEYATLPHTSHRTVRDSLPSYGSSSSCNHYQVTATFMSSSHFIKMVDYRFPELVNPFAPFPLQKLLHYYELIRHLRSTIIALLLPNLCFLSLKHKTSCVPKISLNKSLAL